jgi:MoaA/NifB/PqqE/SkfB family radical SAM enzyme
MIKENYEGLNSYWDQYRRLHVELGTRCNLLCSGCSRTQVINSKNNNVFQNYPGFKITDIGMNNIKALLRPENKIKFLHISSVFSDPIYCGHLFEMLDYINEMDNRPILQFSTNGSGRKPSWWKDFAHKLRVKDKIEFSIDGLRDTNHIYRFNSDWDSIYNGVTTFLNELKKRQLNLYTTWKFIVFKHNQHQIKEAYTLSKEIGFENFKIIQAAPRTPEHLKPTLLWNELVEELEKVREIA